MPPGQDGRDGKRDRGAPVPLNRQKAATDAGLARICTGYSAANSETWSKSHHIFDGDLRLRLPLASVRSHFLAGQLNAGAGIELRFRAGRRSGVVHLVAGQP